jgi:hypothetical protein
MKGAQFFFQIAKEEEVTWSKVWAIDRRGKRLAFEA